MATQRERNKAFYEKNKEREKERAKRYYHENKHRIDREKKKEYLQEYYRKNKQTRKKMTPEQRAEYNRRRRERYANDPEFREAMKQKAKDEWHRVPHVKRARRLRENYGITPEQFEEILTRQGGGCAICGAKEPGTKRHIRPQMFLYVDHSHQTGEVRGILCHRCNMGLGQFQDDPNLLLKALEYLNNSNS